MSATVYMARQQPPGSPAAQLVTDVGDKNTVQQPPKVPLVPLRHYRSPSGPPIAVRGELSGKLVRVNQVLRSRIPPLTPIEIDLLEADMVANGCRDALVVWKETGELLDGHHRLGLCQRHGLPYRVVEMSLPDQVAAEDWIDSNQLGRRNLTPEQAQFLLGRRYNRAKRQGERTDLTSRQSGERLSTSARLAEQHGVAARTVERAGEFANAIETLALEVPLLRGELLRDTVDADGEVVRSRISQTDIIAAAQKVRMGSPVNRVVAKLRASKPHVAHNSCNNEWYTPADIVERARTVLGEFDCDPASCEAANAVVRAKCFYTKEDDGLSQPIVGRIFANPPYEHPLIDRFVEKIVAAYEAGAVTAAVILVNNATDTAWWHRAARTATAVCFKVGRVKFWTSQGNTGQPLQGQCIFYFGPDVDLFAEHFGVIGTVMTCGQTGHRQTRGGGTP